MYSAHHKGPVPIHLGEDPHHHHYNVLCTPQEPHTYNTTRNHLGPILTPKRKSSQDFAY